MTIINIPSVHKKSLKFLLDLSIDQRKKFVLKLNEATVKTSIDELSDKISKEIVCESNEIKNIINLFFSIFAAVESKDEEIGSFIDGLIRALNQTEGEELEPDDTFVEYLEKFLQNDTLFCIYKTQTLPTEREKILVGSRIITDMRPVFSEKEQCELKGTLILHNLKIEFLENNEEKEAYFALTSKDLKKLKEQITRADRKEKSILNKLKSHIDFFNN